MSLFCWIIDSVASWHGLLFLLFSKSNVMGHVAWWSFVYIFLIHSFSVVHTSSRMNLRTQSDMKYLLDDSLDVGCSYVDVYLE